MEKKKNRKRIYQLADGRFVTYADDQPFQKEGKVVVYQVKEITFETVKTILLTFERWDNYLTDATLRGFID